MHVHGNEWWDAMPFVWYDDLLVLLRARESVAFGRSERGRNDVGGRRLRHGTVVACVGTAWLLVDEKT